MSQKDQQATFEQTVDFIKFVIEAIDRRRDAIDSRVSIILASDAVLITVAASIAFPLDARFPALFYTQLILIVASLLFLLASVLMLLQVSMIANTHKRRAAIQDIPKDRAMEGNLFLFVAISDMSKSEYMKAIDALTEEEIAKQLQSQAHNLSRLVLRRHTVIQRANATFAMGTVCFILFVLAKTIPS